MQKMSETDNITAEKGELGSSNKSRYVFFIFLLAIAITSTLMMINNILTTGVGFSSVIGTLSSLTLGVYCYKWICEEPDMQTKQEKTLEEKNAKVEKQKTLQEKSVKTEQQKPFVPKSQPKTSEPAIKQQLSNKPARNFFSLSSINGTGFVPPKVFYLPGVPDDIGFGRGDQQIMTGYWLTAKIYVPEVEGFSFIGRILGPRGTSIRCLESETGCKILIRGRGSVKDKERELALINQNGWAHLRDNLHVLLLSNAQREVLCRERLENAVRVIQSLLIPRYDEYKRQQLAQLAMLNGTYRS